MQLDFGFAIKSLSSLEVTMCKNRACDHSPESLAPLLDDLSPLEYLGYGASRSVYALPCGQHVLKVNIHADDDYHQMQNEINCWQLECDSEIRKLLCPIDAFDPDYRYIVMRRADMSTLNPDRNRHCTYDCGIGDMHCDNYGVLDGRTVVVDYGVGCNTSSWDISWQYDFEFKDRGYD